MNSEVQYQKMQLLYEALKSNTNKNSSVCNFLMGISDEAKELCDEISKIKDKIDSLLIPVIVQNYCDNKNDAEKLLQIDEQVLCEIEQSIKYVDYRIEGLLKFVRNSTSNSYGQWRQYFTMLCEQIHEINNRKE